MAKRNEENTTPAESKDLIEQREECIEDMEELLGTVKEEARPFTDEEQTEFDELKAEVERIDGLLDAEEETRALARRNRRTETRRQQKPGAKDDPRKEETRAQDEQQFLSLVRRGETRALTAGDNGAIIPQSIADRIIERVYEISPVLQLVDIQYFRGDLVVPVWLDSYEDGEEVVQRLNAKYVDELEKLEESVGKFTSIKLTNHIVGLLALLSRSVINRADFDLLNYVVNKVAEEIAKFLEHELLLGTAGKMQGIFEATNVTTTAANNKITSDELIDLQMSIIRTPDMTPCWIMNRATFKEIRKLKDANGQYLFNKDITTGFGWEILGDHVYLSENAPAIKAGAKVIFYGDPKGIILKMTKTVEIEVLREKYADRYAYGIVAYLEGDAKIVDQQKLAVLKMKA